ncbi:MAG: radical SAM protein [Candidatus Omnitrophica bacterium]|nr:radical SAM protein [Candidatus Omnitrophota bacterium]
MNRVHQQSGHPLFVYEVTPRCNNNCLYCYNVWKEPKGYPSGELSLNQIKVLFDKLLKEVTPESVMLTGGEPLLHKDIFEIVSFLKSRNINLGLATNGALLDKENTDKLITCGISYFEISLPSLKENVYQRLCQAGSVKKIREAILNVKRNKARLTVSFVITKLNLPDLEEVIDLSFAFSADFVALNRFVPGGRGLEHVRDLIVPQDGLRNALDIANKRSAGLDFPVNIAVPVESCVIGHKTYPYLHFGTCTCAKKKWVIDPLGNLRTCEQNPEILGSLFSNSYLSLSESASARQFCNNMSVDCKKCADSPYCGGGCKMLASNYSHAVL